MVPQEFEQVFSSQGARLPQQDPTSYTILNIVDRRYNIKYIIDGCVATKQQKNGNLCDSEQKSNLNKLKVCDTYFRKKISFPLIFPMLSLVLFLKSSAINFGRKLHPIHGTEKMETSVKKKSNLIKLKVCDKDLRKQIWFPPRVPILYGPFSQIQCDEFLSQITPHSLVTVPWLWSPSGLRCIVAVDVNKTKQKKSSPDPPP